jgi:hypothetical protein
MERLFIRWVQNPNDPPIRKFWKGWIDQHPSMIDTVYLAKELVDTASEWDTNEISHEEAGTLWNRIRSSVETLPELEHLDPSVKAIATNWYFLRWSAGVVATVLLVILWFSFEPNTFPLPPPKMILSKSDSSQMMVKKVSTSKIEVLTNK